MIRLKKVTLEERELLWNINQKYLYEMTKYYPDDMDENGNYHYGYFDAYFTDPKRRAYFILNDNTMIGFVMLNPYSYVDQSPDNVIAEFSIFPSYRRKHYAWTAANMVLADYPGKWEIKFNEMNIGAKRLWESLTEPYHPVYHHLNEEETVLVFQNGSCED